MDARLGLEVERLAHLVEARRDPALAEAGVDEREELVLLDGQHGGVPHRKNEYGTCIEQAVARQERAATKAASSAWPCSDADAFRVELDPVHRRVACGEGPSPRRPRSTHWRPAAPRPRRPPANGSASPPSARAGRRTARCRHGVTCDDLAVDRRDPDHVMAARLGDRLMAEAHAEQRPALGDAGRRQRDRNARLGGRPRPGRDHDPVVGAGERLADAQRVVANAR